MRRQRLYYDFFFFNDTATTEIYTLSLHDALPISFSGGGHNLIGLVFGGIAQLISRSEEHTSELQSRRDLVCRLLLEKKKIVEDCTKRHAVRIADVIAPLIISPR